jgi:hypothetical protein
MTEINLFFFLTFQEDMYKNVIRRRKIKNEIRYLLFLLLFYQGSPKPLSPFA